MQIGEKKNKNKRTGMQAFMEGKPDKKAVSSEPT